MRKVIRTAGWLIGAAGAAALLFLVGFVGALYLRGPSLASLAFGALFIVGVLGVMDVTKRRVVLGSAELCIVSMWSQRVYPRETIASVKWEGGIGVALKLVAGNWVRLPELGRNSQSVANTIRAWLKHVRDERT